MKAKEGKWKRKKNNIALGVNSAKTALIFFQAGKVSIMFWFADFVNDFTENCGSALLNATKYRLNQKSLFNIHYSS